ncbi:hypothetical protein [Streptomyces lavendulocolor]|uniref:hypothetical protein n=1 Tax=Streptomyces lavendulocolor TaxID=67316 RepID=UPI003C2C8B10
MHIVQLLSLVWLISGVALIVVGLLVAIARTGGLVVIVSGVVWWAPLGFLALRLPAAPGLHALAGVFLALVVPATVLCPAQGFAAGRRARSAARPSPHAA